MKVTSKFRKDLKAIKDIGKFLKRNNLYNYLEPKIYHDWKTNEPELGTPIYGEETKNVKDFVKNLLQILGSKELKKANLNITFTDIFLHVNNKWFNVDKDPNVDKALLESFLEDLPKFADFLNKNKKKKDINDRYLINDHYLSYIKGISVRWEDPDKRKRYYDGQAASMARREKENPGWRLD